MIKQISVSFFSWFLPSAIYIDFFSDYWSGWGGIQIKTQICATLLCITSFPIIKSHQPKLSSPRGLSLFFSYFHFHERGQKNSKYKSFAWIPISLNVLCSPLNSSPHCDSTYILIFPSITGLSSLATSNQGWT